MSSELWYTTPAQTWDSALPIGNGRLGAMIYGRTSTELLQLNESSVWYGGPQDRTPRDAFKHLPRLRKSIREGNHVEAEKLVKLAFFATPQSQRHYEPLGTATVEFGHDLDRVNGYRRSLDLKTAVVKTEYEYEGVRYNRECFASFPHQVVALKIKASKCVEFVVRLTRVSEREYETNEFVDSIKSEENLITMHATPGGKGSNSLCCVVGVQTIGNGTVEAIGGALVVKAEEALFLIGARTTYSHNDLEESAKRDVEKAFSDQNLLSDHLKDYSSLYNRMSLHLERDASHIPTDQRIASIPDPGLISLYHNYGRYLLISCSRNAPLSLPATLQGLWNPSFQPAWGSKYTININLQMNYWPSNICNLAECEIPLFDLVERMAKRGEKTAKTMYGCRGWCAHHNTDIWADTDPQDRWMPATLWPLAGAWLCTHIWESYLFNGDRSFLKRMFPVLKGCVQFLVDFLIEDAEGKYLTTNPSLSPENSFKDPKTGMLGTLCEGSAIDIQIIEAVLKQFQSTCEELSIPDSLLPQVATTLSLLPPPKIGSFNQLQEWAEDYTEVEPGHRHISHLWALHPGHSITPTSTPRLAEACEQTLRRRAEHGGGHTGWSRAWLINMHARLWQAEEAYEHLKKLLMDSTLVNLLDNHPPFQIDGNFGGCAGIVEMLVQSSSEGEIRILPACPEDWKRGEIRGVRCRGGFEVAFRWSEGNIEGPVEVKSSGHSGAVIFHRSGARQEFPVETGTYLVYEDHIEKL